jgi:cyclophilin family peptidyl-prolyl cis-trans isomerase
LNARRPLEAAAVAVVAALAVAASVFAYRPPESNPRLVLSTSHGDLLVALAPENAPKHVEQLLIAINDGDFDGSNVARVSPGFYVQFAGKLGKAVLSGLPIERLKVGNIRGALSVYDSGKPGEAPTLTLALTNSLQLDSDYTAIGIVETGLSVATAIAQVPTVGDHQPSQRIAITSLHVASPEEKARLRQAEQSTGTNDDTTILAAIFIIAAAAFLAAMISAFHDRLSKQRVASLGLVVVLLAFFAVWVALAGTKRGSGLVGVALFVGAIGVFRLMGRFERPAPPQTQTQTGPRPSP